MKSVTEEYARFCWDDEWVGYEEPPAWDEHEDFPELVRKLEQQGEELIYALAPVLRDNLLEHLASVQPSEDGAWDGKYIAGWFTCREDVERAFAPQLLHTEEEK